MPLNEGSISLEIKLHYDNAEADSIAGDSIEQVKTDSADALAAAIVNAIESIRITIPAGAIVVAGSATTQTNQSPIVLNSVVS